MSDRQTDLVIQISTSGPAPDAANENAAEAEESRLTMELRQCLQPGQEVTLVLRGCMAVTSILWLSELQLDRSFRAGIRLFGVSALPDGERPEPWAENSRGVTLSTLKTSSARVVSGE